MAELDDLITEPSESEKRIKALSGKVKDTADERDAAKASAEAAEAKAAEATRERDFYAGFADVLSTNPAAKDHKDDILAKVKSGYSVQDATYAVLGAAGKFNAPTVETVSPTGGSASIAIPQGGATKPISEMSQAERRAALVEAQERGDIGVS